MFIVPLVYQKEELSPLQSRKKLKLKKSHNPQLHSSLVRAVKLQHLPKMMIQHLWITRLQQQTRVKQNRSSLHNLLQHNNLNIHHPFLKGFRRKNKTSSSAKSWECLKQLFINIPFVEALEQMPNYAKLLKDILTKKRRLGEFETVALT